MTQQLSSPKLWLDGSFTLCGQFVENAFGTTAQYPTAYDMYLALGKTSDPAQHTLASLQHAPAGAIVFFAPNAGNYENGHVGIYIGGDQFIGVVSGGKVRQHSVIWWNDQVSKFLGWAYPRADWPGNTGKNMPISRSAPPVFSAQEIAKATHTFQTQWQAGETLTRNLWGPSLGVPESESYSDTPSGHRLVEYFEKGRMELSDPNGSTITNGLLANELITGQMQTGNAAFLPRGPADIAIAGDTDNPGPTYAALSGKAAKLLAPAPAKTNATVTASISAAGDLSETSAPSGTDVRAVAKSDTILTAYDQMTQHNVPAAFVAYRTKVGLPVIGYAKSEPFVTTVKIAGVQRQVMVQVFERRVLTYNAANADPFKVEMGNIGQHYYRWRYGL